MKIVASVCAGIALVASIIAVSSWLDLRKQREVNAARPERQIAVPLPVSLPALPPPNTAVAAVTPPDTQVSKPEPSISSPTINDRLATVFFSPERKKELLKDPNFRKSLRVQALLLLKQNYPDLAQELGLSQDESDRLFDLLADDNFARKDSFIAGAETNATEVHRTQLELNHQLEESVRVQLGDKYPLWQTYQQTRPARAQVASLRGQLTLAGMPLSSEQYKSLTTVWITEQQRQAEEKRFMPQSAPGNPSDPEYRARKEENIRRRLDAAAPYVDDNQLSVMRRLMQQESMQEMALRNSAAQHPQMPAQ